MKNKELEVRTIPEVAENWAKRCQLYGHSLGSHTSARRKYDTLHSGGWTSRTLWILIFLLGMPAMVCAQTNQSSWENLSTLHAGQKIQVAGMKSKTVSGTFESFSDAAISLQTQSGEQTIQRKDIRGVKLMENHHRLRHALIGSAVGAGVGAGIGAAAYQPCSPTSSFCISPGGRGTPSAIGAVAGLAAGAAVGALWPSHKTIYRATGQ
ncbi:MAG: hypothetical protein WCA00_00750 [Candidatus Acidiferrales bacterium]